nr:GDSL esterase/lipase At5g42170-like [Tanacetum cinerariifolium]
MILIPPKDISVSAVFAFGDSYIDQGNNNYIVTLGKSNFPPYGKDFVGGKPTGRFSNGKTLADFFAKALGVKDYLPAYLDPLLQEKDILTGVSFASGGSGYDPLTSSIASAIPLLVQIDKFKQYTEKLKMNIGEKAAKDIIKNSVFLVVASTNDLLYSLPAQRLEYDTVSYDNMLVKLALNFVQLKSLASSFAPSRVAFVDFYSPMISFIENPHQYGLEVTDKVEINNELLEATVQEISSWCIKITDDYIDLSSNDNIKDVDTSSESIDDHSIDDLEHIQTNLNNIVNQVSEQKMDNNEENKQGEEYIHFIVPQQPPKEEANNKESNPECKANSSDLSRPPGFKFIKKSSSSSSKCSTSFAIFRKKDIEGVLSHSQS